MKIHSYVVEHDLGFAPNPFWGFLTLANCKPRIRKFSNVGDVVIGTGSANYGKQNFLVYWMKIDKIINFNEYWNNPIYDTKKPNLYGSMFQQYGDNIYFTDSDGIIRQIDSFHSLPNGIISEENLARDVLFTDRVLISNEFAYFGKSAPKIPSEFSNFVIKGQGHKNHFERDSVTNF
ncbi:hypothetical protein [Larsenimonas salina]|uniref:Nmad2 family putative nucleotide modification protein n=1 Tax=Larsenimonas salina TaxID=1295565 RepID=UPI0020734ECF|nr:hypothetical protein [Larsenimonas salina]MCM5705329.1 hypothetical protein [Larsenimonas salina]